jgi:hypothetical protein
MFQHCVTCSISSAFGVGHVVVKRKLLVLSCLISRRTCDEEYVRMTTMLTRGGGIES